MACLCESGQALMRHTVFLVEHEHWGGSLHRLEAVLKFLLQRQMVLVMLVSDRLDLRRDGALLSLHELRV